MHNPTLDRRVVLVTFLTALFAQHAVVHGIIHVSATLAGEEGDCREKEGERHVDKLQMQRRKLAFLEGYHVDMIEHSGEENLMSHLCGVSELLKDWGLPLHVQDAGLFHSVFGTEVFHHQAVPDTDRPFVRELIGEEAEALTWIFGNMNREEFYQQLKKFLAEHENKMAKDQEGFVLSCTVHGDSSTAEANRATLSSTSQKCELHISQQQIPEIAAMTVANLLEQAPRFPEPGMQAWYRNQLGWELYLFRPLLPEQACVNVEQYLERAMDACQNAEDCNATRSIPNVFKRVENDLRNPKYGNSETPFNFWLYDDRSVQDQVPKFLPTPDFVRVFELDEGGELNSFDELGKSARDVIDANLASSGAVLFRDLHKRITTSAEFQGFWTRVMVSEQKGDWKYYPYNPSYNSLYRPQLDGVDTANNIPSDVLLRMHNEMAYNPTHASKVAFYCLHDGVGGDTTLALNKELTDRVPDNVKPFIEAHGGILYERFYFNDSNSEEKDGLSWQGKTGATTREEAIAFYTERGWKKEDITFNEKGDMTLRNVHRGYVLDEETGKDLWYNYQQHLPRPMADGTEMPRDMLTQLVLALWNSAYAFRLRPGDWLVLDNMRVMHGRYPFKNISPEKPRTLLVVYTE